MNVSAIQKPKEIKKITSKRINIPSESNEISYEQILNNKTIKIGHKEQIIVKDEIQDKLIADKESIIKK